MYRNNHVAPYKPSIRRSPEGTSETFLISGGAGIAPLSIYGAYTEGYFNGEDSVMLEFRIGDEEFRWVFDSFISDPVRDLILSGIKHDPSYRDQFRKPAVPAKEIDPLVLSGLISKTFGEHKIASLGDAEATGHSWEKNTKILVSEKLPADFATFARKCNFLKLSKVKGEDCITVFAPLGNAYRANNMLLTVLEDYAAGKLRGHGDYSREFTKIDRMPTKPAIVSSKPTPEQVAARPSVTEAIAEIRQPLAPQQLRNKLQFLKAGRDEYSSMKAEDLKSKIDPADVEKFEKSFKNKSDVLKCIRWHLRGLSLEEAILKTEIDYESGSMFSERAKASKQFDR